MDARNALSSRDSHIWTLRITCLAMMGIIFTLCGIIFFKQNIFRLQVPPDLSRGAVIKPGEFLAPNSYAFAHFVWRELNDWKVSGKVDYSARIKTYECYVTPSFKRWLDKNYLEKSQGGELDRTRFISTTLPFDLSFVTEAGNGVFKVDLTMSLIESVKGTEVKNVVIRYPLRVVPDNRACNKFGQSIDGFYLEPIRVEDIK